MLKNGSTPEMHHCSKEVRPDWMIPQWSRAQKGKKLPHSRDDIRLREGKTITLWFQPSEKGKKKNYALGGRSSCEGKRELLMIGSACSANVMDWVGQGLHAHSFMQGISPLEDNAGVAEWQTSRAPISAIPP